MSSDPSIHEIYAKSSTGRFIVATRSGETETYTQIGKKDASLTDAERTSILSAKRLTCRSREI